MERTCQHLPTRLGPIPSWSVRLSNHSDIVSRAAIFTNEQATGFESDIGTILPKSSASFTRYYPRLKYTLGSIISGWLLSGQGCKNTFDLALGMIKRHNQRELNMARGRQMHGWLTHLTNERISLFNQSILSELRDLGCHSSLSV